MTAAILWMLLVALNVLLVSLLATRFQREIDAQQSEDDEAPVPDEPRATPAALPRQLLVGALESIQATTPGFTPPSRMRVHAAGVIGWLVLAALTVLTLAAFGGRWS